VSTTKDRISCAKSGGAASRSTDGFANHSCNPNCRVNKRFVNGKPRIGLFAGSKGVCKGDELTFDYEVQPSPCYCGEPGCRGSLIPKLKRNREAPSHLPPSKKRKAIPAATRGGTEGGLSAPGNEKRDRKRQKDPAIRTSIGRPGKRSNQKQHTNPPRTTEYLDLDDESQGSLRGRLLQVLQENKRIVVIAGAGISVSAGIPTFRMEHGLFHKGSGKQLFDASVYCDNSSTQKFHAMVCEMASLSATAKPTPFHHLLASLAAEGRLLRLYTQNVDYLDTRMPPLATRIPLNPTRPWPTTIQLHGGLDRMVCNKCGHLDTFNPALFKGDEPQLCPICKETEDLRNVAGKRSQGVGRLRPRMVLYNEDGYDETAIGNVSMADLRSRPDALLVVGTSLKIPGVRRLVKQLCLVTRRRRDGLTAWINPEPPGIEFKDCWDLVVLGKCDDVAELVTLPRWDEPGPPSSTTDDAGADGTGPGGRSMCLAATGSRKRNRGTDSDGDAPVNPAKSPSKRVQRCSARQK
jgi:NAD-dependent SIR2 family protein deacetylase